MNYINTLESANFSSAIIPMLVIVSIIIIIISIIFFQDFKSPFNDSPLSKSKKSYYVFLIFVILSSSTLITANLMNNIKEQHREMSLDDLEMNLQTKYSITRIVKDKTLNPQEASEQPISLIVHKTRQEYMLIQDDKTFEPTLKDLSTQSSNRIPSSQLLRDN